MYGLCNGHSHLRCEVFWEFMYFYVDFLNYLYSLGLIQGTVKCFRVMCITEKHQLSKNCVGCCLKVLARAVGKMYFQVTGCSQWHWVSFQVTEILINPGTEAINLFSENKFTNGLHQFLSTQRIEGLFGKICAANDTFGAQLKVLACNLVFRT